MARQNKIRIWSEAELIDAFGLDKLKIPTSLMAEWLDVQLLFTEVEENMIQQLRNEALENIEAWAEEDLKMNFIAFVIKLGGLKATKTIRTFYDKTISATVEGIFLKTKTDFMIAKGVLDLMKNPYFHFQEYKRDKDPHGDPMAQLVEAFLIAQQINQNGKPLYGCCVIGRFWYFVTMEEKNYCVSMAYDCTDEKDLHQIIAILRKFADVLLTRLID
jgi:hypothetical protein